MGRSKKIKEIVPNKPLLTKVKLVHADQEYKAQADTILEGIMKLGLDWTQIKTKGVLTISRGKQSVDKLFYLKPLRMLFANKLRRIGWARQLEDLLNVAPMTK